MLRKHPVVGIQKGILNPFLSRILKFMVFFMLLQTSPLPEFTQAHKWNDGKLRQMVGRAVDIPGTVKECSAFVAIEPEELLLGLSARGKPGKMQLQWTNQVGMVRYDVLRATESSPFSFQKIAETTSTYSVYIDYTVSNEITYLYRIDTVFPDKTYYSEVVSAHTPLTTRIVQNYNPVIYSEPVADGMATSFYSYQVRATDPNLNTLSYSLAAAPDGMAIDAASGTITWTPLGRGVFPVKVEVSDGAGGKATQEFTVDVAGLPPTARISGEFIQSAMVGETVNLDGSGSSDPDGDTLHYLWYFYDSPAGSNVFFSDAHSATSTFVPDLPGNYFIQLFVNDSESFSVPAEVLIHVQGLPPTVAMSADPTSIMPGAACTLSWNSTNADSCSIDQGIGVVDCNGSISISPPQNTTYTITATGDGGTATAKATVVVIHPDPSVSLFANPQTIMAGQSATLIWTSSDASSVSFDQGIGSVAPNGFLSVSPTETTTYTIEASGPGGTVFSSITIMVTHPAPTVSITASPASIASGEFSSLSWTSTDATSCVIQPGIGAVSTTGILSVSPTQTTDYTITATGPGGAATAHVTVTIIIPTAIVTGVVTDSSSSEPIAGATVTVNDAYKTQSVQTGLSGEFRIEDVSPGPITIAFLKDAYHPLSSTASIGQGETLVVNAPLVKILTGAVLTGKVTIEETGQLVAGATVIVTDSSRTQSVLTGADGSYTISEIVPGEAQAGASYGGLSANQQISMPSAQTYSLDFSLRSAASLKGVITDAITGLPLAGAAISVAHAAGTSAVQTLDDGTYLLSNIPLGSAQIAVSHGGYHTQTTIMAVSARQTYVLDFALFDANAVAEVIGTLTNAGTLLPEPGVLITLQGAESSDETDSNGGFALVDVPFGPQTFRLVKDGFIDATISVTVDRTPFVLDIVEPVITGVANPEEIGTEVAGFVLDAMSGLPLNGAVVKVSGSDIQTVADADGKYVLSGLPLGSIQLIAMALDHEAVSIYPTVVVDGDSNGGDFALPPLTIGLVTGTVTDAATGLPIRHANIEVAGDGLLVASTEADGTYNLVSVPVGTYSIVINHSEYLSQSVANVVVADMSSTTLNFTLTRRPETGSIQGTVTDDQTEAAVSGALLTALETGATATTDQSGHYSLSGLPAGLVSISIDAPGYPATTRTVLVFADEDGTTATVTTADFALDLTDPTPPESVSGLILTAQGGSIESPDGRFTLVIPPGGLSGDAVVTLMPPSDGPTISPGDDLDLDPGLGVSGIKAIGRITEVVLEPAVQGEEIPTLSGWVLILSRYSESRADTVGIDEASVFPYYFDGTRWTAMRIKPYEIFVDTINNLSAAVVDFSTTQTGSPVIARLGARKPVLLASQGHVPNFSFARKFFFVPAGRLKNVILPPANVKVMDKDELDAVTTNSILHPLKAPNPNALPLLVIHGWDPKTILMNDGGGDPNDQGGRYYYILRDLALHSNGVYRPVFVSSNSRADMMDIGGNLAMQLRDKFMQEPCKFKGLPADPQNPGSGYFPYVNTFGFSMGGLISRAYQASAKNVKDMVIAGTPNHGTFGLLYFLENFNLLPKVLPLSGNLPFSLLLQILRSPGTADLLAYDDKQPCLISENPQLCRLNKNGYSVPNGQMTLIAGTDGAPWFGEPNDKVVPVSSVFCYKSGSSDGSKSLFDAAKVRDRLTYDFDHFNFGSMTYRIKDNEKLRTEIFKGLSDWTVSTSEKSPYAPYTRNETLLWPNTHEPRHAEYSVRVEYNCYARDFDRVVLVVYAMDGLGHWRIVEGNDNGAFPDGTVNPDKVKKVNGNSSDRDTQDPGLYLTATCDFPMPIGGCPDTYASEITARVIMLKPGANEVPLRPEEANFAVPKPE